MPSTRLYGPSSAPAIPGGVVTANTPATNAAPLPANVTILNTTETVITSPANPGQPLVLNIPPGGPLEQRRFELYASGYIFTGTSSTVTIKLYSGTSATVGSDTLLGSSGAITAFAGKAPWYASANLIYDSVSGKLQGSIKFLVNNTLVSEVAVSNVVTGISNTNNPVASFVISVTFGTAGTQVFQVQEFAVNF
jgi:hypothetical protein